MSPEEAQVELDLIGAGVPSDEMIRAVALLMWSPRPADGAVPDSVPPRQRDVSATRSSPDRH